MHCGYTTSCEPIEKNSSTNKKVESSAPQNAITLEELIISKYKNTMNGEPMLLYGSFFENIKEK